MDYQNVYNPLQSSSVYPMFNTWNNMQQPLPRFEVIKVNGENGANAFQMAPNSSVLLLDTSDSIIWFVTTDGAGYKTVVPCEFTIKKKQQQEDPIAALSARLTKLEERINKNESNNATSRTEEFEWNL